MPNHKIKVVSPFGINEYAGHVLHDDEFYYNYLIDNKYEFEFFAAEYSQKRLNNFYASTRQKEVKVKDDLRICKNDKIVFLGFSELSLILFLPLLLIYSAKLRLVCTNNFSAGRFKKRKLFLYLSFRLLNLWIDKIFVHTEHEKKLVCVYLPFLRDKIVVKTHHLLITKTKLPLSGVSEPMTVTFFGPVKSEKPIAPFFQLINSDVDKRFEYKIINVKRDDLAIYSKEINATNVSLLSGWLSDEQFANELSSTDIIFMSHNETFEGKLSGNLCDSISHQIPFISRQMEPMTSFVDRFGEIGTLVDFEDSRWPNNLIASLTLDRCDLLKKNMMATRNQFEVGLVCQELRGVFFWGH